MATWETTTEEAEDLSNIEFDLDLNHAATIPLDSPHDYEQYIHINGEEFTDLYPAPAAAAFLRVEDYIECLASEPPHVVCEFVARSLQLRVLNPTATEEELQSSMVDIFWEVTEGNGDDQEEEGEAGGEEDEFGTGDSGLSEETIDQNLNSRTCRDEDLEEICIICQAEYEREEIIGEVHCGHEYHAGCIKAWLLKKNSCPLCKHEAIHSSQICNLLKLHV